MLLSKKRAPNSITLVLKPIGKPELRLHNALRLERHIAGGGTIIEVWQGYSYPPYPRKHRIRRVVEAQFHPVLGCIGYRTTKREYESR